MKKQTSFGDLEVFDAHAHFFSHNFFRMLASQSPAIKDVDDPVDEVGRITGFEMPPESTEEFADVWRVELDKHHIARSILMASLPGDEDSVAKAISIYPERFTGAFFFDPTQADPEDRAVRIFDDLGFQILCLFPAMHKFSVGDDGHIKALAKTVAERPGTAIFVHCGALSVGIRGKLGLPSKFDLKFSNPLEVHKLASEFPDVNFIIPHFGAGLWREALMAADLCSNIYLDTSSSNKWVKYESSDVNLEQVLRRTLDVIGPERLLFGSDSSVFPRGWNSPVFEEQVKALETIGVGEKAAAFIFGGNLRRVLSK